MNVLTSSTKVKSLPSSFSIERDVSKHSDSEDSRTQTQSAFCVDGVSTPLPAKPGKARRPLIDAPSADTRENPRPITQEDGASPASLRIAWWGSAPNLRSNVR